MYFWFAFCYHFIYIELPRAKLIKLQTTPAVAPHRAPADACIHTTEFRDLTNLKHEVTLFLVPLTISVWFLGLCVVLHVMGNEKPM
jgi:hypothetical protein